MPKLNLNGQDVEFEAGMTILQVSQAAGVEVPVFCYHPKLNIAGNCRMCLVEVEKSPKPVASCAMPAAEGMVVRTNSPSVEKARKGVLEFLLINHPLDCPICDQGGECDLQDITMKYADSRGRYQENKRAVKDKYFGPLIKTTMTRCIHCTRCVRFATEIAGVQELGSTGRGEHMEIGTYVEKALTSELSGNMIDICPVGALTSKPYAFHTRPWELTKTDGVDVFDAVGSNIRIDSRGTKVLRILPRQNDEVNEEWLADKSRFSYDGLHNQRLDRPFIRNAQGRLVEASWQEAFQAIAEKISQTSPHAIAAFVGDMVDAESIFLLKKLMEGLKVPHLECRVEGSQYKIGCRGDYLFNTTIVGLEQADACLLIGTDPRKEAPLINARLRKRYFNYGLNAASIGPEFDATFPCEHLGNNPKILQQILSGKHAFSKVLKTAKNPILIIGTAALIGEEGEKIHELSCAIAHKFGFIREGWNGFNVLHTAASRVGALELGFVPQKGGKPTRDIASACERGGISVVYSLGADDLPASVLKKSFFIYQGHHGDKGASHADVILPGCAFTEKNGLYVNVEGRVQHSFRAVFAPGEAKEDWRILRALADILGVNMPYVELTDVREAMAKEFPLFATQDRATPDQQISSSTAEDIDLKEDGFVSMIDNYYMSDPISRHSVTMARCTQEILSQPLGADNRRIS